VSVSEGRRGGWVEKLLVLDGSMLWLFEPKGEERRADYLALGSDEKFPIMAKGGEGRVMRAGGMEGAEVGCSAEGKQGRNFDVREVL
jgi:hypothetical protein